MKLAVISDGGEILDTVELTREEWEQARSGRFAAFALLQELNAGTGD